MKKVVLAFSGGLDTSCAVKWLQEQYGAEVICFSAFIGEVADKSKLRKRANAGGATKIYIEDLKEEFAKDFIMPALWAHARYEGKYPLATALGRPLIAKHLVQVAQKEGAEKLALLAKGGDAGLQWSAAKTVSRREAQGIAPAALRKIMTADASKLPAHAGAERGDRGYAIFRISKVIPGEYKPDSQSADALAALDRQSGAEQFDAYVASLRARAKVEINSANLEKK